MKKRKTKSVIFNPDIHIREVKELHYFVYDLDNGKTSPLTGSFKTKYSAMKWYSEYGSFWEKKMGRKLKHIHTRKNTIKLKKAPV